MVSTAMMGRMDLIGAFFVTISQALPSQVTPAATALAQSMVLPPPTASTTSSPCSRQMAMPFSTVVMRGLGSTPASSSYAMPFSAKIFVMASYRPIFLMLPPPYTISTLLPCAFTLSASWASCPLPKNTFVGM